MNRLLDPTSWHQRFLVQASWTRQAREYLIQRSMVAKDARILDVGCGTGAILQEFSGNGYRNVVGLDIDHPFLKQAKKVHAELVQGDAILLPFNNDAFDMICCHYLLLWLQDPMGALLEIRRTLRPGSIILLLAEPDYGGRIDYPPTMEAMATFQSRSLERQGIDLKTGRKLTSWLTKTGFVDIESGVMGGQWTYDVKVEAIQSEWAMFRADLYNIVPRDELEAFIQSDFQARQKGERVLFIPTFYAFARKPLY